MFWADDESKGSAGICARSLGGYQAKLRVTDPVYGDYTLGSHNMWIERAKGTPKGHPEVPYTVEIACTLLKKGAVCWMALAASDDALKIIEGSAVALEGDRPIALVPTNAFEKKPSS
jgi:hypothetical protein